MFHTLVVPLDGSQLAERAVPYAIRLAQASHARVVLVQAVLAPPPATLDGTDWERNQVDAIAEVRTYLSDMADSLSGQVDGVEVATPYGRAAEKILETVETSQADCVVMSTHGRTGFDHLLHGSVTEAVLAKCPVPVFVVYARPGEAEAPILSPTSARLLVAQDGSSFDAPVLQAAVEMLGPRGEIVLTTVVTPPERILYDDTRRHVLAYIDQQEESLTREARDYLTEVAESLRNGPTPITAKIAVRMGDAAGGIAMAAIDTQADLIVMATHGRTGINRALFGSVAGTVMRTAATPVVLIHPTQAPPPDTTAEQPVGAEAFGPVPTF
jgi:nucleotide-binding universal stress UspA family protein